MCWKVQKENAKSFAKYSDFEIEGIRLLYLSADNLLEGTGFIESAPKNPLSLMLQRVIKGFNVDGV